MALIASTSSEPSLVKHLVGPRDNVVLPHAGFQLFPDHVIGGVDHRRRLVEKYDLVDVLDLAGVEHDLLPVDQLEAGALELQPHARLDEIDADRHVGDAGLNEQVLDLLGMALHQAGRRRHGAAHAEHAGPEVLRWKPVAIKTVMHRC